MNLFKIKNLKDKEEEKKNNNMEGNNPEEYLINSIKDLNNEHIKFIKNGLYHIITVTQKNEIFVFGSNENGELGTGDNLERNNFYKIVNNFNYIKYLGCGVKFTVIVNDRNEVYLTGNFNYFFEKNIFTKFCNFNENIKMLRCGLDFIYIVTNCNNIYVLGSNSSGQLGICGSNLYKNFTKINNLHLEIKDIQCGNWHTILLDKNGSIYGTGDNHCFQLNENLQKNYLTFTKINLPFKVIKISCYDCGTFLLNDNFDLFGFGQNTNGKLGVSLINYGIHKIVVNHEILRIFNSFSQYNVITTDSNDIYVTGSNRYERFGINNQSCRKLNYFTGETYLDQFTKLNYFNCKRKYLTVLLLERNIFILTSDYEINMEENDNFLIQLNIFSLLKKKQLCDIQFVYKNTKICEQEIKEVKKRKLTTAEE